jgi:23S rRNA (guanosine2251-2'-O)-methyltransferase
LKIKRTGRTGRSGSEAEWIYGLNPVLEALRSGRGIKSVVIYSGREKDPGIEGEATRHGLKIQRADSFFFDSRFPKGHQGVAALVAPREYAGIDELLSLPAAKNEAPLFLLLDLLEDPRNFGAVLRVADAGGVHGVVIQSHRSVSLSPEAVKASAGAAEYIPVAMVSNIKHAMRDMSNSGITIVGAEADTDKTLWDLDLSVPLAVVMGSEGKGMRRTVRENCDILVSIPMKGRVNSLNVSVATGVVVFEIMRQRMGKKKFSTEN